MPKHTYRGMRRCPKCGARLNFIDWMNHDMEHLSEEEKEDVRSQLREAAKKRDRDAEKQIPEDEAEMWRDLARGE